MFWAPGGVLPQTACSVAPDQIVRYEWRAVGARRRRRCRPVRSPPPHGRGTSAPPAPQPLRPGPARSVSATARARRDGGWESRRSAKRPRSFPRGVCVQSACARSGQVVAGPPLENGKSTPVNANSAGSGPPAITTACCHDHARDPTRGSQRDRGVDHDPPRAPCWLSAGSVPGPAILHQDQALAARLGHEPLWACLVEEPTGENLLPRGKSGAWWVTEQTPRGAFYHADAGVRANRWPEGSKQDASSGHLFRGGRDAPARPHRVGV